MPHAAAETPIKAYWQPGCTSCLRMKEFLAKHGVPFISVNVLEDKGASPSWRNSASARCRLCAAAPTGPTDRC
jgi:hypothetical protein